MIESTLTKEQVVVNGTVYNADQVHHVDASWHIRRDTLTPLSSLLRMMDEQDCSLTGPMGVAGRVGLSLAGRADILVDEIFYILERKGITVDVIISTDKTPGVAKGQILDVEIIKREEV